MFCVPVMVLGHPSCTPENQYSPESTAHLSVIPLPVGYTAIQLYGWVSPSANCSSSACPLVTTQNPLCIRQWSHFRIYPGPPCIRRLHPAVPIEGTLPPNSYPPNAHPQKPSTLTAQPLKIALPDSVDSRNNHHCNIDFSTLSSNRLHNPCKSRLPLQPTKKAQVHIAVVKVSMSAAIRDLPSVNALSCIVSLALTESFIS
ncbi:hypothetical protein EAG_12803 [Camponotus floridanus]|uniref:Uncharacterized protein n=1 Tax=Camponotus floridanus TaxID=104421 RepID=E2ASY1_CAMFO|nr:hypothetical protein EAG_12803 [Camponotus floridanus]